MAIFKKRGSEDEITEDTEQEEIKEIKQEVKQEVKKKAEVSKKEVSYIEREVTLSLINEKANFIIGQLNELLEMAKE